MGIPIGRAAAASGVKVPTIRYYEEIGLIVPDGRTMSNRRTYSSADVARLRFIRHARDLGFGIGAIRDLLGLAAAPERSCDAVDALAARHIAELDARIAALQALRAELERMVAGPHGRVAECRVVEVLSDHALCHGPHAAGQD